jgi:virginiamycin B lyase
MDHLNRRWFFALVAIVLLGSLESAPAADYSGTVQGVVKDSRGAPVAGAFVKMKNAERRLTFMVISQDQGHYMANHLPPGSYAVQAVGGDYQSEITAGVEVKANSPANADLALTDKRAPDLPYAWPGQAPGFGGGEGGAAREPLNPPEGPGKQIVMGKCSACHDATAIVNGRFDRAQWEKTIDDMQMYAQGSDFAKPLTDQEVKTLLDYVTENFSSSDKGGRAKPKPDPNSRLPRELMQGEQRKYIAVEYELPDTGAEPHEVSVDNEGNGWVTQRTGGRLGRLDLKTLTYTEIDPPAGASDKVRLNGIVRGSDDKFWFLDGGPNRCWFSYDTVTKEFNSFTLPKLKSGSASGNTMRVHPNGTVWLCSISANQIIRLDPKTKQFTVWDVPSGVKAGKTASPYGMAISGDGKVWFVENAMGKVGRIDPATGKIDEYPIPVKDVVARKMGMDSEGNIWVGLHIPGKLMKIDYKTLKMTIFDPPTKNAGVYSVQGDPTSKLVWFSEQQADRIGRFDPTTQTFTEFPLANAEEDPRRIEIDPNHPNRIWWSGDTSGHMGYIELLDGNSM